MLTAFETLTESVATIWVVWVAALAAFGFVTPGVLRRLNALNCRSLARDESGAVYVLSVTLIVPFYLILVCTIIETSLILVTKLGTIYAAYSAARSAIVWDFDPPAASGISSVVTERARNAAQFAMVPLASGTTGIRDRMATGESPAAEIFLKTVANSPVQDAYLERKVAYAYAATQVSVERSGQPQSGDDALIATVEHAYPFRVAIVGRMFGATRSDLGPVLVWPIRSTYRLPTDAPQNADRRLGIVYRPE